jgi:hypothetical protein
VHDDVDAAEAIAHSRSDRVAPFNGRDIRCDELNPRWKTQRCSGGR